jgi:Winged helix DNA-binding domain
MHRQGLDGSLDGCTAAQVLQRSGWARSVGGVGPYLTLFARAGLSRESTDAALATLQIVEIPAVRGCTYVLSAADVALGLACGAKFSTAELSVAEKLGVTTKEIDRLCAAVLTALDRTTLTPDALRAATGTASRSLGEEGKQKGVTTTLPVALGLLQARGEIRRVSVNGRLDQQRYAYARWTPNPCTTGAVDIATAPTELARRYFTWIGPTTMKEFQWFSGLGVAATKSAVAPLALAPTAPESDLLMLPQDVDAFAKFRTPAKPQYALVSSLDSITAAKRNISSLLDETDASRRVVADKSLVSIGGLSDLPSHAILDRGQLIGLWEYDADVKRIVYALFGRRSDAALNAAITTTETFVREQLGDARSFSLDSPKSRAPRIAALKAFS